MKACVAVAIWLFVLCSANAAAAAAAAPAGAVQRTTQQSKPAAAVTRVPQPAAAAAAECVLNISGRTKFYDRFYGTAQMTCTGGGKVFVALAPELEGFKSRFTGVQFHQWSDVSLGQLLTPCLMVLLGETRAVFVRSTIVNVEYNPPILCVVGNSHVTFKGIAVENNRGTGLLALNNATVLITDGSRFTNTTGGYVGSAIVAADQAKLTITGKSRVRSNKSPGCGGGVRVQGNAKLYVEGASMINNNAGFGGGGVCAWGKAEVSICCGSVIANNTSFKPGGCHGGIVGGGILVEDNAVAHITNAQISGNQAAIGGGLYAAGNNTKVVVESSIITGNRAIVGGAAALEAGASLKLQSSKLQQNAALAGGAIFAGKQTRIAVDKCEMSNNAATAGGALLAANAQATLRSSTVSSNIAAAGAGVWAESSTVSIVDRSTLTKNMAGTGGGLFGARGAIILVGNGSVVASNTAQFGSGIWLQDNVGASVTFVSGGQLARSNSAATGTMPAVPLPTGMASDSSLLEEPGAPDPVIPATSPGISGSKLSLPSLSMCGYMASRTYDAGSYLHAIAVASAAGSRSGASAKPTGVRPLRPSAKCPGNGSTSNGDSKPAQQATMC
jgi:hypothetical protein